MFELVCAWLTTDESWLHPTIWLSASKIKYFVIFFRITKLIRNIFERRIPICGVLGGGYNKDFKKLVELHASLHKNCAKYLNDKK